MGSNSRHYLVAWVPPFEDSGGLGVMGSNSQHYLVSWVPSFEDSGDLGPLVRLSIDWSVGPSSH